MSLTLLLSLFACRSPDYGITAQQLTLELTSPEYGEFLGAEAALVTGRVSPMSASLVIEDQPVELAEDGSFSVALPMDGLDYRMIEVQASLASQSLRERVPVFSGSNPALSWPGQATARLTEAGLDEIGETVGAFIDATGWDTMIVEQIPSLDTDWVDIYPTGLTHLPTVALLEPDEDGIHTTILIEELSLGIEIDALDGWINIPIELGFSAVSVELLLSPTMEDDGSLWLYASEATIDLGETEIELGSLDGWLVELILDAIVGFIEPLGDILLESLLGEISSIELGGPLEFDTDLLGTRLAASLSSLWTDDAGLGAGLGIGINDAAPSGAPTIPTPGDGDGDPSSHAQLALHEGAIQLLLEDSFVDLLASFDLGGMFGSIIGAGVAGLPGGDQAPSGDGWCVSLDPGSAYVVRMKSSLEPLAQLHMPDFRFTAGVQQGSDCVDWIDASLELTLDIGLLDGRALDLQVQVPDGALLSYGASPGSYDEDEVVAALGSYMGTMIGLLGGFLDFDLGELLGGLGGGGSEDPLGGVLGDLDVQFTDSRPLLNDDGTWTEGLYVLSLDLFAD